MCVEENFKHQKNLRILDLQNGFFEFLNKKAMLPHLDLSCFAALAFLIISLLMSLLKCLTSKLKHPCTEADYNQNN